MLAPSERSSSAVRRGSLAISRRYAVSVPASSSRLDTRRAYIKSSRLSADAFAIGWPRASGQPSVDLLSFRSRSVGVRLRRMRTDEIGRRRFHQRGRQPLLPVVDAAHHLALDVRHELVHLALHLLDLAPHVENDFHAGEVDAEISGECQNGLELIQILFRIQTRIAFRP